MTKDDALELGEKISKSIAERFRKHVTGIDANVVFAALIAKGTFRVFVTNKILRKFSFRSSSCTE